MLIYGDYIYYLKGLKAKFEESTYLKILNKIKPILFQKDIFIWSR